MTDSNNGWTAGQIKALIEGSLNERDKRYELRDQGQDDLFEAFQTLVALEFTSRDESLRLQAKEYERRLDLLNHEHERIKTVQNQSVTQEKFEASLTQVRGDGNLRSDAINKIDKRLENAEGASRATRVAISLAFALAGVLIAIVTLLQ